MWVMSDGTRNNTWANRYTAGGSWGTATMIELDDTGGTNGASVEVDADGNAIAVWYRTVGTQNDHWSNRFVPTAGGWGTAVSIEDDANPRLSTPTVAVNASGKAIALWSGPPNSTSAIYANHFD